MLKKYGVVIIVVAFVALVYVLYIFPPCELGIDWKSRFRPASLKLLSLQSPYYENGLQNPFWVVLPLIPIALLPPDLGAAVMFVLTFFGYGYACYRLGIDKWGVAALMLSPFVLETAIKGNIDWLVAIGLALKSPWGLLLACAKPQLSLIAITYLVINTSQKGVKPVIQFIFPVIFMTLASFVLFGFWPILVFQERLSFFQTKDGAFPLSVIPGIILTYHAFKKKNYKLAISASPLLSPYMTFMGYGISLLGLTNIEIVLGVIMFWLANIFF